MKLHCISELTDSNIWPLFVICGHKLLVCTVQGLDLFPSIYLQMDICWGNSRTEMCDLGSVIFIFSVQMFQKARQS